MRKYIIRHIVRAPARTLYSVAVAFVLTFMLGFMLNTIANLNAEIDKIYDETIVYAEVRMAEAFMRTQRFAGDAVSTAIVEFINSTGIVTDMYLEGSMAAFILGSSLEDAYYSGYFGRMEILLGIDNLKQLTGEHTGFIGRDDPFHMYVEFAENADESDFADSDIIPIILSRELAESRGLSPGDRAYIVYYKPVLFREGTWEYAPVTVLGIHDGNGLPGIARRGAIIPLATQQNMLAEHMGYLTVRFSIDPAYNRELVALEAAFAQAMRSVFTYPRRDALQVDMWNQELRFGVASLAQHVALLRLLFPVIATITAIIGGGLVMLSMLQNAKNAATIRVLGMPKDQTRFMLWIGQAIIAFAGVLAGLLLTMAIGLRTDLILVILPYMTGALIGATAGVVLITNRAPLDLLQVKD